MESRSADPRDAPEPNDPGGFSSGHSIGAPSHGNLPWQVRVKIDDRFRKTETSLKDVVRLAVRAAAAVWKICTS